MNCKFDVKKCIGCIKYNNCLLQSSYSTNLTLLDALNSIILTQQAIISEIDDIKNFQKTISEDSMKNLQENSQEKLDSIDSKLTSLLESYEIVSSGVDNV